MNPPPADWPRLTSSLIYRDAAAAIDWLGRAFGFDVRLKVEGAGGRIDHSELVYGEGVIMVGQEGGDLSRYPWKAALKSSLSMAGGTSQSVMIYVDYAESHCARARAAGARIVAEPETHDYGADYWADRSYGALDPEGHLWWVTQRIRNPPAAR